jgi:MerR family transcriptional regulator/heat shock protein HspR
MDKPTVTRIIIQSYRAPMTYSEQETMTVCRVDTDALCRLRELGLIAGQEASGELRYSEEEVLRVRRIRRLRQDLGVNLAGVEVILHLLEHLEAVQRELEEERRKHEH